MSTITIGVNVNGAAGSNRIRFEKLSERLQKVNIDILHKVTTVGALQTTETVPDSGELGCFFQDELEQCKKLETSRHYRKFHWEISQLTQSLPELLHHQDKVVTILTNQIISVAVQDLASYFNLMSVLARDLKDDLQPHFHKLVQTLLAVVNKVAYSSLNVKGPTSANPELTGKLFETLSHLLKSQWDVLSKDPDCLRQYYGPLLGNGTTFIRDFAAKSFVLIIRKTSNKAFKSHMKKVIFALATNSKSFLKSTDNKHSVLECEPLEATVLEREAADGKSLAHKDKRVSELFEGVSLMIFYTAKGVKGRIHSKAIERLRILWSLLLPVSGTAVQALRTELAASKPNTGASGKKAKKSQNSLDETISVAYADLSAESKAALEGLAKPDSPWKVFSCGKVFSFTVWKLFRHLTPSHLVELWQLLLDGSKELTELARVLASVRDVPAEVSSSIAVATSFVMEMLYFGLYHSNGRGVNHKAVQNTVGGQIISTVMDISELTLGEKSAFSGTLVTRSRLLFCQVWQRYPQHVVLLQRVDRILSSALPVLLPVPAVTVFAEHLLATLPYTVVQRHLLQPMLAVLTKHSSAASTTNEAWLGTLLEVLIRIHDPREDYTAYANTCSVPSYDAEKGVHSSSAALPRDEKNNDDDSWNASDSDDESASDNDSIASSVHSDVDDGADPSDKVLYKSSSKLALGALTQCSDQISLLAHACLDIVHEHVNVESSSKSVGKGGKKVSTVVATPSGSPDVLLSAKSLAWFLQCLPQLILNGGEQEKKIVALCSLTVKRLIKADAAGSVDMPLLSELIALSARLAELHPSFLASEGELRAFVGASVKFLQANPYSVALSWAVHSILSRSAPRLATDGVKHPLVSVVSEEERVALLHVMGGTLSTPSYWLRYNWLRILTYLPPAQLAEPEVSATGKVPQNQNTEVDIAKICLEAVCLSPDIRHEREYARRIGVLEVHVRSGRLSAEYMRLVCGFCLGLLHFKFKPIWEPAVLVLVSAAKLTDGEATMWPLLLKAIESTTSPVATAGEQPEASSDEPAAEGDSSAEAKRAFVERIASLGALDNGDEHLPLDVVNSELFYYKSAHNSTQLVEPDARTDAETVCTTVWNVLKRSPNITLKRSKVVVGMFLTFLTKQYYQGFKEDPEVPFLRQLGLFSVIETTDSVDTPVTHKLFPIKTLKKRLEMFLQVFAAVTSPKQMFCHQMLYAYYQEIMAKADVNAVKLAFDCIVTYKPIAIVPYKDNIKRMLEDKSIRDELINFDPSPTVVSAESDTDPVIKEEHRAELIPILMRTVYGRFTSKARGSKAARDQNIARRAAVLAFVSKMQPVEMRHLLQLMLRGIVPSEKISAQITVPAPGTTTVSTVTTEQWYDIIDSLVQSLEAEELDHIAWERQIGFLHLLQPIIRILGFGITSYVPIIHKVVLIMLNHAQNIRAKNSEVGAGEIESDDEDEEHEQHVKEDGLQRRRRDEVQALRVRSLCLLRIAEMIDQYHEVYNFMTNSDSFFLPLQPLIVALPTAISSCRTNCPAILRIFHSLSLYEETISVLAQRSEIVCTIIQCISSPQATPEVMRYVTDILHLLIDLNEGSSIFPHAELIIRSFSKRFIGPSYQENAELKLSEMDVTPTGSVKTELKLLCRIASGVFQRSEIVISPVLVNNLAILLLGMLRTYTTSRRIRVEEDWVIDILKIYQTLLFRMADVTNQIAFISRLFGPATHSYSLFNWSSVRMQLVQVLGGLAAHPSTNGLLNPAFRAIEEITSEDPKLIGSKDFGRFMPVLQSLSREGKRLPVDDTKEVDTGSLTWAKIMGPDLHVAVAPTVKEDEKKKRKSKVMALPEEPSRTGPRNAALYGAVLYESIRCMYDSELVVRTAAVAALKRLISDCAEWSGAVPSLDFSAPDEAWLDVLRSILIPAIRRGFKQSSDVVKRGFIILFAHLIRAIGMTEMGRAEEVFHGDLSSVLHEDPEQDFFENIVHIQSHRRVRALAKLRNVLISTASASADDAVVVFSPSSFNHVLLPLVYHFLFSEEFQKKDHLALMQESAAFVGAVGKHLRWNHYLNTIKTLLKQLEKGKADKEKVLLSGVCSILDSFHFNLSGTKAANLKPLPDRQGVNDLMALPEQREKGVGKFEGSGKGGGGKKIASPEEEEVDYADNGVEADEDDFETEAAAAIKANENEDGGDEPVENIVVEVVEEEEEDLSYISIAQTLVNSVLPWVQVFLLKDGKDHKGHATRTVQPHVALALTKLIQRLEEPVVTTLYKHNLFTNLVIRVISTLKSHDTSGRDAARDCLAKMITTLGLGSLKSVLFELQFALKEGFQRHVCNYTVRTILRLVLANYAPDRNAPSVPLGMLDRLDEVDIIPLVPDFDRAIPLIMQSALDDLAGGAQDDREADEAVRSLIREAKGSKANDTLELTARCLLFRPTYALLALEDPASLSSIHALTIPLLNSLQQQQMEKPNGGLLGRIAEALQRVALGLSKNSSLEAKELLLYLHSTLQPFVGAVARDLARHREAMGRLAPSFSGVKRKNIVGEVEREAEMADDDILDEALPSYLREESSDEDERALYSSKKARGGAGDDVTGFRASTWLPSDRRSLLEQRAVVEARNREARARIEVQDGRSAPKLTGRNKYTTSGPTKVGFNAAGGTGGDRSTLVAIKYCLTLLYSCLKQNKLDSRNPDIQAMAIPFLPLLGKCLQLPAASSVVALAIRCMTTLIGWGIPVDALFLTALGNRLMRLMFKGGGLVSTETELAQACTKGLSALFKIYNAKMAAYDDKKESKETKKRQSLGSKAAPEVTEEEEVVDPLKPVMPLSSDNMRSLVQLLTVSIMEVTSTFQTAAFQLVREIVATRVLIPEIYDLVTKLAEQIVLSQRKGVREAASSIVVTFLITYPLGEKRVSSQLKQLINNCEFEFEEGRTAALRALVMLIKALPLPVLEDYAQMLFLPACLRVVNDKAAHCREQAAAVIVALVRKVGTDTVLQFQEYVIKWLSAALPSSTSTADENAANLLDTQRKSLVRTGSQIAGLIVKGRPDICKRDGHISKLVQSVHFYLKALLLYTHGGEGAHSRERNSLDKRELSKFDEGQGELGRADTSWGLIYHLVCLVEQLYLNLPAAADHAVTHISDAVSSPLMELMQESLLFPHAWVRAVSVRVLLLYTNRRDVTRARLSTSNDGLEVLTQPNGLYHFARRLCIVLNQTNMSSTMLEGVVGCTVFVVRAMLRNPDLNQVSADLLQADAVRTRKATSETEAAGADDDADAGEEDDVADDDDDEEEGAGFIPGAEEATGEEAEMAAMNRAIDGEENEAEADADSDLELELGDKSDEDDEEVQESIHQKGGKKRKDDKVELTSLPKYSKRALEDAFEEKVESKPDAGAVGSGGAHWIMMRMRGIGADFRGNRRHHIIKVFLALVQAESAEFVTVYVEQIVEVAVRATLAVDTTPDVARSPVQIAKELAAELLERLEAIVGSAVFIGAYSEVQRRIQSSKAEKRRVAAAEAIAEPQRYAARKIEHAQKKKEGKKRQTLGHAAIRGLKKRTSKSPAVY